MDNSKIGEQREEEFVLWRKMISYVAIIAVTVAAFFTTAASTQANQAFSDVKQSDEAYTAIEYLVGKGVIQGYTEDNEKLFKPYNAVKRAQVAKMIVIASGNKPKEVTSVTFPDLSLESDLTPYVERAAELGYFETKKGSNFKPFEDITRGEMSYALTKAFKLNTTEFKNTATIFADVDSKHAYAETVNAIYYNGIAMGASNFNPDNTLTRAQFSLFVARASDEQFRLELPVKGDTNIPQEEEKPNPDNVIAYIKSNISGLAIRTSKDATSTTNIQSRVNTGGNLAVYDIEGKWLRVTHGGKFGYVHSDYVTYIDGDTRTPLTDVTKKVEANEDLNLYVKATSSSKKITPLGIIKKGTELNVYRSKDGYYQVLYQGVPGYIVASSTIDLTPAEPEEPTPPVTKPPTSTATATVGRVTVDYVNVRAQANNQSKQLGQLRIGQRVAVNKISGYWANINYNGQSAWVYKSYLKLLNQNGLPLQNRIIVIDPGHGGKDPGAVSNGYNEKSIVLKVGNLVNKKLRAAGADVRQTRTTDKFLELSEIVSFTNRNEAEIFVSIHVNSFSGQNAHGTETYYSVSAGDMYKEDHDLATFINSQIVRNANMYNRGIKTAPFYVTRNVIIPAVLVELGFISNDSDRAKLVSDKYVEIYAESIYQGIVQYYSKQ